MGFLSFERYLALTGAAAGSVVPEEQNTDYESGRVEIDGQWWRIRTANVTPTKPGAFVAVWRRNTAGETEPFDATDECAGLLVFVTDGERIGWFTFDRALLTQLRISSTDGRTGKRGFRVYPAWSTGLNAQAERTQRAQAPAFTDASDFSDFSD
ncbi:MepB family protein [Leucobacter sp. cx-42]|uniref:MepB family protein n=1 Tax=unclassified Leucobacter TaxID=2621730 RepID=UPI00165D4111|nr:MULTISPECIES: MepB family protein [unclassified Leucobacter]MBC9953810.1 MepB family protein [Leucobacter sp. cx-42]